MARGFTDKEKEKIKEKLLIECEQSWAKYGYKKTSIDDLCVKVGISKGSFYLFFDSKEAMFLETLCNVQDNMYKIVENTLRKTPNKQGFAKALKKIYCEYNKKIFITDLQSPDFLAFTNKLSEEQLKTFKTYGRSNGELFLNKPYLNFLIDKKEVAAIITSLLSIVSIKDRLPYDDGKVFNFMIDNLVDKILE